MTQIALSDHSRFVQRIRRRFETDLTRLGPGLPTPQSMQHCLSGLRASGHDLGASLRILRALVIERLATLDCEEHATLADITQAMTDLAELALNAALVHVRAELVQRHGEALRADQHPAELWIVGMGKLGARELNVSSDIDLIYLYDEDGETAGDAQGRGRLSNHEFFVKVVRAIYALIGDTTEYGFVFRVDLALRPNGNSGPAAVSLDALQEYLYAQGREWERFAWLKSRVVAPRASVDSGMCLNLPKVIIPFVFRRYLDYNVFDALRTLHRQVREHAAKRSAGHPERANDVKLSRGGIREIEFIVQLLQVVRGGQYPELRTRPTLSALARLVKAGLMPQSSADMLATAYGFLRRVEHRIQYLDDQQTHVLPTSDADLSWIAATMDIDGASELLKQLDGHRELVAQEFDSLLGQEASDCSKCQKTGAEPRVQSLADLLPSLSAGFAQRLQSWREHPRVIALRDDARQRLIRLLERTNQWLSEGRINEAGAIGLVDWMEPLLRRESYLALLLERPTVHERLLRLLGAARWPARYLLLHPGVIDELAAANMLDERFDPVTFEAELDHRLQALHGTGEDDDEVMLNLLRRAHHAEMFRTLARDIEGRLKVEDVSDDLSALADAVLRITTRWCWTRLKKTHRAQPLLGIVAYGKLGGKELGYGSDLDIVFVFEDDHEDAPEVYANLVRKLITWLTVKTGEGDLYEIDTALRPNGNSGLLVSSFASYANYQQQRGNNTAWTWEHQAITRARCVLATPELQARFEAVRLTVITAEREPNSLRTEIMTMRERVREAHPVKAGHFDVKHSAGGMIDAEFVMQFLVLLHARAYPELVANAGNIALLERAEVLGLLPEGIGHSAADAYRNLRRAQHRARLNEDSTQLDGLTLLSEQTAIQALWQAVFLPS